MEPKPGEYDTVVFQVSNFPLGITENKPDEKFSVFPIPASDKIFLNKMFSENAEITITNILGEKIYFSQLTTNNGQLSTNNFPEGIYFLNLQLQKKK